MQTNGKHLDMQARADRAQALARASGNPAQARRASRLQARADRLRKIDKAILRTLRSHGTWTSFGDLCASLAVPEGAHIRADYTARINQLLVLGKIERQGWRPNVEYRAKVVDGA